MKSVGKYEIASQEMRESNARYEKMKAEYEAIEEEVDQIDLAIETAKNQMNETNLFKATAGRPDQCPERAD